MKIFANQITKDIGLKNASVNSTSICKDLSLSLWSAPTPHQQRRDPPKSLNQFTNPKAVLVHGKRMFGLLTAKLKCTPFIIVDLAILTVYFLIQTSDNIKCLIYFNLNCVIKFIWFYFIWSFHQLLQKRWNFDSLVG